MNLEQTLELHITSFTDTDTIEYRLGFYKGKQFKAISKGYCTDREYITNKLKEAYGDFQIYEK